MSISDKVMALRTDLDFAIEGSQLEICIGEACNSLHGHFERRITNEKAKPK